MSDSREYPTRPFAAVGAIVRKGKALLVIRRGKPPLGDEWSVPGGAVELGETMREAAVREVLEECGIEIVVSDVVDTIDIIQRDAAGRVMFHYAIADYAANWASGELHATSDVTEAHWVLPEDLDKYPMNPKTRTILEKGRVR